MAKQCNWGNAAFNFHCALKMGEYFYVIKVNWATEWASTCVIMSKLDNPLPCQQEQRETLGTKGDSTVIIQYKV